MATGLDIGGIGDLLQETFRTEDGLRRLLQGLLNLGMREEASVHVGAEMHERSSGRVGYRNGTKPRSLKTRAGELELEVPQVRNCEPYHPSFFARFERSERALLVACSEMYFQGVSTRNVRAVLEQMCQTEVSAMTVSRVAAEVDEKLSGFRARRLDHTAWEYLMVDARYEKVRVEGRVVSQAVLVTVGFSVEGKRELLDWRVDHSESEAHWGDLFASLKDRGFAGVKLIVSDAHRGIRAAFERHFQGAPWQRCRVHYKREMGRKVSYKKLNELNRTCRRCSRPVNGPSVCDEAKRWRAGGRSPTRRWPRCCGRVWRIA